MERAPIRIIAHRGASACAPENTLAAFDAAVRMGVHEVEADARLSADGHPVLIHDAALERTTNGAGLVRHTSLSDLASLDAGSWWAPLPDKLAPFAGQPPLGGFEGEAVPALRDLFNAFGDAPVYHVDLKDDGPALARRVAGTAAAVGLSSNVIVTGHSLAALEEARRIESRIRIGWTMTRAGGTLDSDHVRLAAERCVTEVVMNAAEAPRWLVRYARRQGLHVRLFGLADGDAVAEAVHAGASALTLDYPSAAAVERIGARAEFEPLPSRLGLAA